MTHSGQFCIAEIKVNNAIDFAREMTGCRCVTVLQLEKTRCEQNHSELYSTYSVVVFTEIQTSHAVILDRLARPLNQHENPSF